LTLRIDILQHHYTKAQAILQQHVSVVFAGLFIGAVLLKLNWLYTGGAGFDLTYSDIPKSLLLLHGQNPYADTSMAWAAPYPPFLLFVDALIIRLTSSVASPSVMAWNMRVAGLVAELSTGLLIFLALRSRRLSLAAILVPSGIFLLHPAISSSLYFWFHSDVFGILILAASMLLFARQHYFTGTVLLALATVFKIHPALSLFLMMAWLYRRKGLAGSLPIFGITSMILAVGLVVPFMLPGYRESFLSFNLQNGDDANGMNSLTLMNLFYGILPSIWNIHVAVNQVNQVWIACTAAMVVVALGLVWQRFERLDPLQVVVIGLIVWLLPLRHLYNDYLVWMFVPLFMLGRTRITVLVAIVFELASVLANSVWINPPNLIPGLHTPLGFFVTSLVLAACLIVSLFAIPTNSRIRLPLILVEDAFN